MLGQPVDALLARPRRVLVVGAGGGFDVLCGLPLALHLAARGHGVVLANLTFTQGSVLAGTEEIAPGVFAVGPAPASPAVYFPERHLVDWYRDRGREVPPCYAVRNDGFPSVAAAYRTLVARHAIDLLLLVDGGVDALLRGDEYRLGTPVWDAISLAAALEVEVPDRVLACLGFGAERWDGIAHAEALEAFARLAGAGALLGVSCLLAQTPEGHAYMDALRYVHARQGPTRTSIVNGTVLAALRGEFGERPVDARTETTPIWVSPLAQLFWFAALEAVAQAKLYLPALRATRTLEEAARVIEDCHARHGRREAPRIPI